jgi:hypothetical protein
MTAPKISILPVAASRSDPTNFAARGDALVAAQANFVTEANNLGTYVEVQANTVAPSLSYAEQAQAAAALALIYKNDAAAAVTYQDLSAFALSKAITMVDGFVYRTANDSDGGAWRERTQGTTWYNETLDTTTRGSTRKFPSVAIIIAEADKVTIFNGDDPACPMWMVFNTNTWTMVPNAVSSVGAKNSIMCIGTASTVGGLSILEFVRDQGRLVASTTTGYYKRRLADRNVNIFTRYPGEIPIVSRVVNSVAMHVYPNAPIDPATGLQIPTIFVATDGGLSVINNDGTVADSSFTANFYNLDIYNGILSSSQTSSASLLFKADLSGILADGFDLAGLTYKRFSDGSVYPTKSVLGTADNTSKSAGNAYGSSLGLTLFAKPESLSPLDAVAFVTTTYNSGYMVGDIKGAFLSSTAITSLVNGNTDDDRSVNANGLTVTGTINRDPVATGADLVGYSGFSESNYMGQAYNTGLNFGTGEFLQIINLKMAENSATEVIFERDSPTTAQRITLAVSAAGLLVFTVDDATTTRTATGTRAVDTGTWQEIAAYYDGAGGVYIYLNGTLEASATGSALLTMTNAAAILRVGLDVQGANPLTNGSLALLRISATAPSAEQIAEIYHDERPLFQPGAQSTIYGASDAVTAIAHDKGTDLLHVGTSAGRSVFSGLQRVSNTVVAVPGVISASNDLVIEG